MENETVQTIYRKMFTGELAVARELLGEEKSCLLALWHALSKDVECSERMLQEVETRTEIEQQVCLEAQAIIKYQRKQYLQAKEDSLAIVQNYPQSAFARYLLCQIAWKERKLEEALEHYRKLVETYSSDALLFEVADTLVALRRPKDALEYVKRTSASLRRMLYSILIPLSFPRFRLFIMLTTSVIGIISGFNIWAVASISILIIAFALLAQIKMRATFIAIRLISLLLFLLLIWFTTFWLVQT